MANTLIPPSERTLTPDQVERVDARRRRGQLLLTLGFQAALVTTILSLWAGQDATYSPAGQHMIDYWATFTGTVAVVCLIAGIRVRRGFQEFMSY